MKNKKYNRDRKGRFAKKSQTTLMIIFLLGLVFGGYWEYMNWFPEYASAEINVAKPVEDNRSISEHVWEIMDEFDLSFNEKINAVSVIQCESGWNPYAIGDGGKSLGLWQIHRGYHPDISPEECFDVYASTRWAINKYLQDGSFEAWTCGR